jgi:hypothetical protein
MNFHLHLRDIRLEHRVAALPRTDRHRPALRPARSCPAVPKAAGLVRAPLSRLLSPSTLESGGVHSVTEAPFGDSGSPGPKTRSGRGLTSAAVFRPRRFYDLDGLLRHPLLPGFPRVNARGVGCTLQGLPTPEDSAVTGSVFPSWPSPRRSCLRSRSRLHRRAGPPGVCSVAPSRSSKLSRPSSPAFGFPPAGTRSLMGFSWWDPLHPKMRGPVTYSEL